LIARLRQHLHGDDALQTPWGAIMLFLTPALLMYVAFTAYPVSRTFYNSFFIIRPGGREEFVGFDNFVKLLSDDYIFWTSVGNTLTWATVGPILDVGVGLLLALFLYAKVPFARFFRIAWFTPVLISYVVVAILWLWIYNYDWGIVNGILRAVGLDSWTHAWIGDPDTALWAIIITHAWKWAGFNMVVCLAALHALPSEVLEAAELDNCGWLKKLWFIIIPLIRPTLLNLLILAFIGKMKVFDLVWIMTQGGPLWSTETVST
jgi:multiple sugar transport system permease protein/raffinose/stachyose/melibiose transport system permease protein